jgi:hypothetical protein
MKKADVDRWLQAYVAAWKSDPAGLCSEFTEWYMQRPEPAQS